jgi:hypothetical protein
MSEELKTTATATEATVNDRFWAALSWIPITPLWPIMAILALLLEDTRNRPYIRRHAVLSVATGIALIPLSIITCGLGALLYLLFFYWAYQAYVGREVTIPVVTDWVRKQGWL